MSAFVYVQAVAVKADVKHGAPGGISFRHTVVEADDEGEAYELGQEWADQFVYNSFAEVVNDYVIPVGGRQ